MCPASEDGRRLDVICLFSSIGDLLEGVSLLLVSQFSAAWLASEAVDSDSAALKLLRQSEPGIEQKRSDLTTCKLQHDMGRLHAGESLPLGARRQDEATIRLASQKGLTLHTSLPTPSAACSAKPSSTPSTSTTPPSPPAPSKSPTAAYKPPPRTMAGARSPRPAQLVVAGQARRREAGQAKPLSSGSFRSSSTPPPSPPPSPYLAMNMNKPSAAELLPRVRVSMTWRRERDSNPRSLAAYRFSRAASSTTPAPLRVVCLHYNRCAAERKYRAADILELLPHLRVY